MGLLLLESHLLLLVDDRLLDDGVDLLDGGARIVGQQDLLLPLDPLLLLQPQLLHLLLLVQSLSDFLVSPGLLGCCGHGSLLDTGAGGAIRFRLEFVVGVCPSATAQHGESLLRV